MKNKFIIFGATLIVAIFAFLYINTLFKTNWIEDMEFNYEPIVIDRDLWHEPSFDEESAILQRSHNAVLGILKKNIKGDEIILDIGEYNLLTSRMEKEFPDCIIINTSADLDTGIDDYARKFDVVIMNHVVEHLFNPLLCLTNIRKLMKEDAILLLGTPITHEDLKLKWSGSHFHEFDARRLGKLFNRTDLRVVDFMVYDDVSISFLKRLKGIRPFIRPLVRKNILVTLRKQRDEYAWD